MQHSYATTTDISAPPYTSGMYFVLSTLNGSNALLAVFDQYMIKNVTVTFMPLCVTSFIAAGTVLTVAPTSVYNTSVLTTCIDTDDANAPINEAAILDHESAMMHGPFVKPFSRSFVPALALETYQTGGFGGYGSRAHQWCDSGSPNVQHYGLKWTLYHGTTVPVGTVTMAIYVSATVAYRKRF